MLWRTARGKMRQFLQKLPLPVEFLLVVLGAFGLLILVSLLQMFRPTAPADVSDEGLRSLIRYEVAVLAVLLTFLHLRGWTVERIGIRITLRDTLIGLAFVLVAELIGLGALALIQPISPRLAGMIENAGNASGTLSIPSVIAFAIVNPVFEETFVCGYVIAALRGRSQPRTAINASVAIRLLYHLYQGPAAAIGIVPFGLILAYWYARSGRLWPAITAHAAANLLDLGRFVVW
jgi:membrane protease YdiL (CAAX protease family)